MIHTIDLGGNNSMIQYVARCLFDGRTVSYMILRTNIVPHLTIEISKIVASGGSMHASVKLEGIDGRAPQDRVEHVA